MRGDCRTRDPAPWQTSTNSTSSAAACGYNRRTGYETIMPDKQQTGLVIEMLLSYGSPRSGSWRSATWSCTTIVLPLVARAIYPNRKRIHVRSNWLTPQWRILRDDLLMSLKLRSPHSALPRMWVDAACILVGMGRNHPNPHQQIGAKQKRLGTKGHIHDRSPATNSRNRRQEQPQSPYHRPLEQSLLRVRDQRGNRRSDALAR